MTDRRAAASDTLATSYILTQAIRTIGRYDFVFCGRQAIDGDTAQVGPQCAEKLGITQITYLEKLLQARWRHGADPPQLGPRLGDRRGPAAGAGDGASRRPTNRVRRRPSGSCAGSGPGCRPRWPTEVKEAMPNAGDEQAWPPRRPAASRPCKQQDLLLEQWDLDDIDADLDRCGLAGSPTKVFRIQSIVLTKSGYTEIPPTQEGVKQLIHELVMDHTLG